MENDVRWKQRFSNFKKALNQLRRFTSVQELNEMEEQGLIKAFEYTYRLGWKTIQDLIKHKGFEGIVGPKPVIEHAFQIGIIKDGESWVKMHFGRNLTSHTYDAATAKEVVKDIKDKYFQLFLALNDALENESDNQGKLFN